MWWVNILHGEQHENKDRHIFSHKTGTHGASWMSKSHRERGVLRDEAHGFICCM